METLGWPDHFERLSSFRGNAWLVQSVLYTEEGGGREGERGVQGREGSW